METVGSPGGFGLVMKSPRRAGRSYTQLGNTGLGCVGFFLLCLSLSIFRVTSAGCRKKEKVSQSSISIAASEQKMLIQRTDSPKIKTEPSLSLTRGALELAVTLPSFFRSSSSSCIDILELVGGNE